MNYSNSFILLFALFVSFSLYGQNYTPNEEDLAQFNNIERVQENAFIPVVKWPTMAEEIIEGELYSFELEIQNLNKQEFQQNFEGLESFNIVEKEGKLYGYFTTKFGPHNAKQMAKIFYGLGVSEILIESSKVNIYHFTSRYKAYAHEEIRKTRVYLKS